MIILNSAPIFSPLQPLLHPLCQQHGIQLSIKRDDLIHPTLSGNKWRKLKFTLEYAKNNNYQQLVSFGGAYSNHIHALAFAGKIHDLKTHGIIRGEYDQNNPTMQDVISAGMTLDFISRVQYKQRRNPEFLEQLRQEHPNALIVPEGGTNKLALDGVAEIMQEIALDNVDYLCTPCGSGGTTAGLLSANSPNTQVLSIPVLKNASYLKQEIAELLGTTDALTNLQFIEGYHFGGYGKVKAPLLSFIEEFYQITQVRLEPIYSGKMVYAIFDLLKQGYFPRGSHVVLLHTGGLQGLNGLIQRQQVPPGWLDWQRDENITNS